MCLHNNKIHRKNVTHLEIYWRSCPWYIFCIFLVLYLLLAVNMWNWELFQAELSWWDQQSQWQESYRTITQFRVHGWQNFPTYHFCSRSLHKFHDSWGYLCLYLLVTGTQEAPSNALEFWHREHNTEECVDIDVAPQQVSISYHVTGFSPTGGIRRSVVASFHCIPAS